jgi:hypothetical protein
MDGARARARARASACGHDIALWMSSTLVLVTFRSRTMVSIAGGALASVSKALASV